MDSQRWSKVREILERALEQDFGQRAAWLARECGDDTDLLREVESLIASEPRSGAFEPPVRAEISRAFDDRNIGRTVGPYAIERLLGAGGMGSVYLARRAGADFDQRVALKVTKRGMDTDDLLAQFRRERSLLAGLRHSGIAQLYDGGATDDGLPWFAMEYVDGQPIDVWCREHRSTVRERVELFVEVCGAVQFAHQSLVVHRDLKPSNILVTRDGAPKLLDFGIAKLVSSDSAGDAQLTLEGQRRLTPDYASPEQLGGEPVTTASDVYSLGVILCELLTGINPFHGSHARVRGDPPRPSTLLARLADGAVLHSAQNMRALRGDLDTIVTTALAVDALRRYKSVEALSTELQRWLRGLPIEARPATVMYLASRFVRRNRLAVAAAAAVFVSLLAGLIAARAGYLEAVEQRGLAEQREVIANTQSQRANSVLAMTRRMLEGANPEDVKRKDYTLRQLLDDFDAEFAGIATLEPEVEASVREILGNAYCELGVTDKARGHLRRAMDLRPDVRTSVEQLDVSLQQDWIQVLHNESKFDEALGQSSDLLARLEASHAPFSTVVEVLYERGDLHRHLKQYDRAEADLRRALALGAEHGWGLIGLAMGKLKLAQVLDSKAVYDEAAQLSREALAGFEASSGVESSDAASAHGSLGLIAEHRGDEDAALESYRRAVDIERAVHGDSSYRLAPLIDNLGRIYLTRGDYDSAIPYLREAVAVSRATLGPRTPGTAMALSNLGRALDAQAKFEEAEQVQSECLSIRLELYGEESSEVARVLNNLGMVLTNRNKPDQAQSALERALAIREKLYGSQDASLSPVLANLSRVYLMLNKPAEARTSVERALAIQRALPKPDPAVLSGSMTNVAAARQRDGDIDGAIELLAEAIEIRRATLRPGHPDIARVLSLLGEAYMRAGRLADAELALVDAESMQVEELGENHVDTAKTRQALGLLAQTNGRFEEAERFLRACLDVRRKSYGEMHKNTLETARLLAALLDARGATESAAALRLEFSLGCDVPSR